MLLRHLLLPLFSFFLRLLLQVVLVFELAGHVLLLATPVVCLVLVRVELGRWRLHLGVLWSLIVLNWPETATLIPSPSEGPLACGACLVGLGMLLKLLRLVLGGCLVGGSCLKWLWFLWINRLAKGRFFEHGRVVQN